MFANGFGRTVLQELTRDVYDLAKKNEGPFPDEVRYQLDWLAEKKGMALPSVFDRHFEWCSGFFIDENEVHHKKMIEIGYDFDLLNHARSELRLSLREAAKEADFKISSHRFKTMVQDLIDPSIEIGWAKDQSIRQNGFHVLVGNWEISLYIRLGRDVFIQSQCEHDISNVENAVSFNFPRLFGDDRTYEIFHEDQLVGILRDFSKYLTFAKPYFMKAVTEV